MHIERPTRPNGLYLIVDSRMKRDREIQDEKGDVQVFRDWMFGVKALGRAAWSGVTRIALYDFAEDATDVDKAVRRSELTKLLKAERPKMTCILKPRSSRSRDKERDIEENKGLKGHQGWLAAKAPDKFESCAGAVFDAPWGPSMGLFNPINNDFSYAELTRRHLLGAHAFATGKLKLLTPPHIAFMPDDPRMWEYVRKLSDLASQGVPISVDLETTPSSQLITAVGMSAGDCAVSFPWNAFKIAGGTQMEPAGPADLQAAACAVLASAAPKVFHNGIDFDVPYLRSLGYVLGGAIHDTMALCAAVNNQWPKGLQKAVSAEFLVPAWKSAYRVGDYSKNSDEFWTADPPSLRKYNCLDAYYTLRLFDALTYKAGIRL